MPLTLVIGRANAGKTGVLYDIARNGRGTPTVLVPSAPEATRVWAELAGRDGLVALRVLQIDRYLAALWDLHGDGRRIITSTQRAAIVRAAVERAGVARHTQSARTRGFSVSLERLVALGQTEVEADDADDLAASVISAVRFYQSMSAERGLIEHAEAAGLLARSVRDSWFDGPLLANRFDDLTPAQETFLIGAARAGADVHVALVAGEGPELEATQDLVGRLRSLADKVIEPDDRTVGSAEISALEQAPFGPGAPIEPDGDVILSTAYGGEAEAERIAAEILEANRCGIPLEQIAVIFRDTRRHVTELRRALSDAGIPADYDVRPGFAESGLGRAIVALLDFAAAPERAHLTAFLASGYAGVRPEMVDEADASWRRSGVRSGLRALLAPLAVTSPELAARIRAWTALARKPVTYATVSEWNDMSGSMLAFMWGSDAPVLGEEASLDAAAHRRLCAVLDDLAELGDVEFGRPGMREALMASRLSPAFFERPGHVQVMDVERVRGRRFDCVILGGLVAGEFPRREPEGFLAPGALADRLVQSGVAVGRQGTIAGERLLFYLAITRARHRLVLSRQAANSDGRPLAPSPFLEELLERYAGGVGRPQGLPERRLAFADLGLHDHAPQLRRRALRTVALAGNDSTLEPVNRAFERIASPPERLEDPAVLEHLVARSTFSATELEAYLRCPYSWFLGRHIAGKALDEEPSARVRGRLVHDVLYEVYSRLPERTGAARVGARTLPTCLELVREVMGELRRDGGPDIRLRDRLVLEDVGAMAEGIVRRDASFLPGFEPFLLEWSFGDDREPGESFGEFTLRGRIDRVDRRDDDLVVIDYKTGRPTPRARFVSEGALQAPLYAEVVGRRFGGAVAASFYRSVRTGQKNVLCRGVYDPTKIDGPELVSTDATDDIAAVIDDAVSRANEAVRGIRAGHIPQQPITPDACKYCGARTWCAEVSA